MGHHIQNKIHVGDDGSTKKKILIGVTVGLIVAAIIGAFKYAPHLFASGKGELSERKVSMLENALLGQNKDANGRLIDSVSQFAYDPHVHPFTWPHQDLVKTNIIDVIDLYGGDQLKNANARFAWTAETAAYLVYNNGKLGGLQSRCLSAMTILKSYDSQLGEKCEPLCSLDLNAKSYNKFFPNQKLVEAVDERMHDCKDKKDSEAIEACSLALCLTMAVKYSATELKGLIKARINGN